VGRSALVLEDEAPVAEHIVHCLKRAGFARVDQVADGEAAIDRARDSEYDILLLDRMTPSLDGLAALAAIRRFPSAAATPALFLTALGSERHRIEGLAAGGDDYLVKPVSDEELLARVAVLLRRQMRVQASVDRTAPIHLGALLLMPRELRVSLAGTVIDLTAREFSILQTLAENAGLPVTRSMLWSRCWSNYTFQPSNFANTIDVHISRLRRKLAAAGEQAGVDASDAIVALRTQGFTLRPIHQAG
jgi:two-component system OmpR family response regulator